VSAEEPPLLRVVRGDPTDAELAALIAVVAARTAVGTPATDRRTESSRWAQVRPRPVLRHGPGAWQASARTR
jgi:hypothetical protein